MQVFGSDARLTVGMALNNFAAGILPADLTEPQLISAELINDSFFEVSQEARFLLCISAIEALCEQKMRDESVIKSIDALVADIGNNWIDKEAREQIIQVLKSSRRESVGRACRAKIENRLGKSEKDKFGELYETRSKFLHEGKGRGALSNAAGEALELATKLLLADIEQSLA
jgi:hypothetical protein